MKLIEYRTGEKERVARQVTGKIKEFRPGTLQTTRQSYHRIKLEGDEQEYIVYAWSWLNIEAGTLVTLHFFEGSDGLNTSDDNSPDEFYLDGIEVHKETDEIILQIRSEDHFIFKE